MTTPTISTLLLVPADGDPMGLLAEGPCGARPPLMALCYVGTVYHDPMPLDGGGVLHGATEDVQGWLRVPWAHDPAAHPECPRALVLAHEGKPVPEGMDRAWRALRKGNRCPIPGWGGAERTAVEVVRMGAGELFAARLGTLLALDPAGQGVTDEMLRG